MKLHKKIRENSQLPTSNKFAYAVLKLLSVAEAASVLRVRHDGCVLKSNSIATKYTDTVKVEAFSVLVQEIEQIACEIKRLTLLELQRSLNFEKDKERFGLASAKMVLPGKYYSVNITKYEIPGKIELYINELFEKIQISLDLPINPEDCNVLKRVLLSTFPSINEALLDEFVVKLHATLPLFQIEPAIISDLEPMIVSTSGIDASTAAVLNTHGFFAEEKGTQSPIHPVTTIDSTSLDDDGWEMLEVRVDDARKNDTEKKSCVIA